MAQSFVNKNTTEKHDTVYKICLNHTIFLYVSFLLASRFSNGAKIKVQINFNVLVPAKLISA